MESETDQMPIAISRLDTSVETSREPQNARAIAWLLQQIGGPITVVTPRKDVDSSVIKKLIRQRGVVHLSWRGLSTQALHGRVLFAWPDRQRLNDLWGIEADALAVIEWNTDETQKWIEDNKPILLLHDRTERYVPDESKNLHATPVPDSIDFILRHVAEMAAGYSNGLKWNEEEKLKADMMNRPQRWASVTVDQVRARCKDLGMRPNDVDTVTGLLQRRKEGHSFRRTGPYRDFHFTD
ncbi:MULTISPECIES: hypothetical protein [unclassified Corynebacterium]|uniref:hypothetical protein n=1 Tax=unclassified Corynebacterium TaxID=2624378 RepID=UPI0029CA4767|nr:MULTISPECIES: hypothetical protein [unclassified Corynebacterium]WPF65670.1 hypothetical protein OLX12_08855 [Corynebacterium sp. 22KM0430]WPF68166.1 hypothetical protein OLW90_08850 [Corynebacterium sp. 21KM1197]